MSSSPKVSPGRIKRGRPPKGKITKHNCRVRALPELIRDFKLRCAYSDVHANQAGGIEVLEVEHFDPRQKKEYIQKYSNLLLGHRAVNQKKGTHWPCDADRKRGIRLLNPCKEQDYGPHIREEIGTGILKGITPAGKYQILIMGLNSDFLVQARLRRTSLRRAFTEKRQSILATHVSFARCQEELKELRELIDDMILEIPAYENGDK